MRSQPPFDTRLLFPVACLGGLAFGLTWKWSTNALPPDGNWITFLALSACMVAAWTDLQTGKIYNWLTYPTALMALIASSLASVFPWFQAWTGAQNLTSSLLGAGMALGMVCLAQRLMGGGMGDVKLAGAMGALVGPALSWNILDVLYVSAAVWSLGVTVLHLGPVRTIRVSLQGLVRMMAPGPVAGEIAPDLAKVLKIRVRLGPFFAIGAAVALALTAARASNPSKHDVRTNPGPQAQYVSLDHEVRSY